MLRPKTSFQTPLSAALTIALLASLFIPQAYAGDYHVVGANTQTFPIQGGQLSLTETIVQDGPVALNSFTMSRMRRNNGPTRGVLLLTPGLGNSFQMYLFHESGDIRQSMAAVLARAGYEVWGYSPRETGIASGACMAGLDCSPALEWGLATVVNDVAFIRSQIGATVPGKLPVIGGLSLGAITALAVVNAVPADYAGVLAWEGSLATDDAGIRAHNQVFCDQFTGMVNAGLPVDDQSLPFVKALAQFAFTAPNDPFILPAPLPPGMTNHQAFVFVMSEANPIAPSPRPGFKSAAGDFISDQLYFSDDARLFGNIAVFNDATANRMSQDLYCGLSGADVTHTANLSGFSGPVMIIKGGQGFGSIMDELPAKLGSTSVTAVAMQDFGHVDHMGSPLHWFMIELPMLNWLKDVVY